MNRKFLEDYEAKEKQEFEIFTKKYLENGSQAAGRFPRPERFSKLADPLVYCDFTTYRAYKEKIWSQIPFAGTLIIPLLLAPREQFLIANGFDVSDIPQLIRMARETGRVQFVLFGWPSLYEGLDHLDPIFSELRPPCVRHIPSGAFIDNLTGLRWEAEFRTIADIRYFDFMKSQMSTIDFPDSALYKRMEENFDAFFTLKLWGMDDLVENI